MALNLDKIISENENVSLEDLPIESLVQTDFDSNSTVFNKLFEDHLAVLINQNGNKDKLLTETMEKGDLFDLDLDCIDIEDSFEKSLDTIEPLPLCYINLIDFAYDTRQPEVYLDSDEMFSVNDSDESDTNKKLAQVTRRQSTRIQDQTRKKIAEQIQRENIRLAKEAQRLTSRDYISKDGDGPMGMVDPAVGRYLSLPTDLDAEDDVGIVDGEWKSDDDPNKLWCICKQPYGLRRSLGSTFPAKFMICCDNCSEWYHGDCVGVTQEEGARMEENGQDFICPVCVKASPKKDSKRIEPVVISDDEDDNELLHIDGDDDCRIIKTVKPMVYTSNIFQIFKSNKLENPNLPRTASAMPLSARTSVCLNAGCKTLVNPKRSLYCSKKCIEKYTKTVCKNNQKEKVAQYGLVKGTKLAKMTRFVLAQIETEIIQDEFDAPTEENLKEFLLKNPTYKVFQNAQSTKTKQDPPKAKKVIDLLTKDAAKRVKVVKHFSLIFKKLVSKSTQIEFRTIWQQCVNLEEALFTMCDKSINEKYISKAKEMSEIFKLKFESRMSLDFIHEKLSISDLLAMTKDQLDVKCKSADCGDLQFNFKNGKNRKSFTTSKMGISTLLSDTTHLHTQHLYDINCKICNGTSRANAEKKKNQENKREKEREMNRLKEKEKEKELLKLTKEHSDTDNIILPTDSCSSESIVTSWFNKTSDLIKCLSPNQMNNDEFKVTSTVETPDMAIDMELCSTPSASEHCELVNNHNNNNIELKVDSSSKIDKTPSKPNNTKPTRQKLTSLWEGKIIYKEVYSMICKTYLVSRHQLGVSKDEPKKESLLSTSGDHLREEINLSANFSNQIKINGRSSLSVVQDYLRKLRKRSNKEFLVFRLHPTNLEEGRETYLKMFEFFHANDRCGVIDQKSLGLKDCFIYPLNAHSKIPSFCYPLNGPGFEKRRPHLLLMLVVRTPFENTYKSFSPKYDQDHDFVKNHGINLEKYYQAPVCVSVCPSPIVGNVPEEKPVLDINTVEDSFEDDGNSPAVIDKERPLEPPVEKPADEEEVPCDDIFDDIDGLKSPPSPTDTDHSDDLVGHNDETTITHQPPADPVVDKDTESVQYTVNFDQIFNPTKLGDNVIPFLSYPTESSTDRPDDCCNYSADVDLRLMTADDSSLCQQSLSADCVGSSGGFLDSPRSQKRRRNYTYYDAHIDDPDCQSKRARYFFNPRCPSVANSGGSLPSPLCAFNIR